MRNVDVSRGAALAGGMLVALPVLDLLLGGGAPAFVHAIVGGFGFAFLAVSAAAGAGGR